MDRRTFTNAIAGGLAIAVSVVGGAAGGKDSADELPRGQPAVATAGFLNTTLVAKELIWMR
jgi:hypothetical protein